MFFQQAKRQEDMQRKRTEDAIRRHKQVTTPASVTLTKTTARNLTHHVCAFFSHLCYTVYRECGGGHGHQAQAKGERDVGRHFCLHCHDQQSQGADW